MRKERVTKYLLLLFVMLLSGCDALWRAQITVQCMARLPIRFSPPELLSASVGKHYRQTIELHRESVVLRVYVKSGKLPQGLKIVHEKNNSSFSIEGIPVKQGVYEFVIEAYGRGTMCSGRRGRRYYELTVKTADG